MEQKPEEKRRNGGYEIYPAGEKEKAENRVAKVYYLPALRGHGDCVLHLRPQIHDDRARGAGRGRTDSVGNKCLYVSSALSIIV